MSVEVLALESSFATPTWKSGLGVGLSVLPRRVLNGRSFVRSFAFIW
jgi:hypothetical protein